MLRKRLKNEHRTIEQLRKHYEIEKELATRLRNAPPQERRYLYSSLYDELFRQVSHHSLLTRKASLQETFRFVSQQIRFLKRFVDKNTVFLEIGPGDCTLSFKVAELVKQVYAIDVSEEITKQSTPPRNFELILSDGSNIPLPASSINVAYSHQLMEHLHPDDAIEQVRNIYTALVPGGTYICITPNRFRGPCDISRYFDTIATGFHLKEYTFTELSNLFKVVGFTKSKAYVGGRGIYIRFPTSLIRLIEKMLIIIPLNYRNVLTQSLPLRLLLGIQLIGVK